jgi:hypothetical protein
MKESGETLRTMTGRDAAAWCVRGGVTPAGLPASGRGGGVDEGVECRRDQMKVAVQHAATAFVANTTILHLAPLFH